MEMLECMHLNEHVLQIKRTGSLSTIIPVFAMVTI